MNKVKNDLKESFIVYVNEKYGILYHVTSGKIMKCRVEVAKKLQSELESNEMEQYIYEYLVSSFGKEKRREKEIHLKRIQIMTSSICNLNCKYCYANGGNYGYEEELMSTDIADKIINLIIKNKSEIREIDFFGGEPMLGYKIIMYVCHKLSEQNIYVNYSMVSNMTYLPEEIISYIKKFDIRITVSLDGPKEITDSLRIPKFGANSTYDQVISNVNLLEKNGIKIKLFECTYGNLHKEKGWTRERIKNFFEEKFPGSTVAICDESKGEDLSCSFEYEPIPNDIQKCDLNEKKMIYKWYTGKNLETGNVCLAGKQSITVMPNGDVYPCQIFVKHKEWKIGNIQSEIFEMDLKKNSVIKKMEDMIREKTDCKMCRARISCQQCLGRVVYNNNSSVKDICRSIREGIETNFLDYFENK